MSPLQRLTSQRTGLHSTGQRVLKDETPDCKLVEKACEAVLVAAEELEGEDSDSSTSTSVAIMTKFWGQ